MRSFHLVPAIGRCLCLLLVLLGSLGISVASAAPRAKQLSPHHAGNAMDPQWSADAQSVAYEVVYSQEKYTDLFLLGASGKEQRLRPSAAAGSLSSRFSNRRQVTHEFAWAPGSQLYAFSSSGTDDDFDLYLRGVSLAIGGEFKEGGVAFSADGRFMSFCSGGTGDGDLYLLNIYELEKPPVQLTTAPGLDFYGIWSPQGDRIAYVEHSGGGANIRVIEEASSPKRSFRSLTGWDSIQLKPSWSPDGAWIAFYSNYQNEDRSRFDVWIVAAAGGQPVQIAADVLPSERRGPAWTPNGEELVLVRNAPSQGDPLIRVDVQTREELVIPTATVNNSEPSLAEDPGSGLWKLAFVSQGRVGASDNAWRAVWSYELPRERSR